MCRTVRWICDKWIALRGPYVYVRICRLNWWVNDSRNVFLLNCCLFTVHCVLIWFQQPARKLTSPLGKICPMMHCCQGVSSCNEESTGRECLADFIYSASIILVLWEPLFTWLGKLFVLSHDELSLLTGVIDYSIQLIHMTAQGNADSCTETLVSQLPSKNWRIIQQNPNHFISNSVWRLGNQFAQFYLGLFDQGKLQDDCCSS